jgi:penicillin amidase
MPGNRATIVQGQAFTLAGRSTTFGPSWRMVTDLGTDEVHTALPGGPSGRRFSRFYRSDLERWMRGEFKILEPPR